ncbi:helix-hairpin-helix domain-containing protein [Chloroflexota bacterium]
MGRFINNRTLIAVLLIVIIIAGSLVAWSRYSRSQTIEISLVPDREIRGQIHVGGDVNNPGIYPLVAGDSIDDILRAAGGTTDRADLNRLEFFIPALDEGEPPQRIDINRAEEWLLTALPGIGEGRAQAIINYRQDNGLFHNINGLVKVEGIGTATFEKIKHLITVTD